MLSQQFPRPPFQHVSNSLRPLFNKKSQSFTKFAILEPRFIKVSVPKPRILQNFSSKASNWAKIQFFKPLLFPKNQLDSKIIRMAIKSCGAFEAKCIYNVIWFLVGMSPDEPAFNVHIFTNDYKFASKSELILVLDILNKFAQYIVIHWLLFLL